MTPLKTVSEAINESSVGFGTAAVPPVITPSVTPKNDENDQSGVTKHNRGFSQSASQIV